jgi:hypothetical protein
MGELKAWCNGYEVVAAETEAQATEVLRATKGRLSVDKVATLMLELQQRAEAGAGERTDALVRWLAGQL